MKMPSTRLQILLAAAERLVEAVHGAGIGPRDDEEVFVRVSRPRP